MLDTFTNLIRVAAAEYHAGKSRGVNVMAALFVLLMIICLLTGIIFKKIDSLIHFD